MVPFHVRDHPQTVPKTSADLEYLITNYSPRFFDELCRRGSKLLRILVRDSIVIDKYKTLSSLAKNPKQVLHLSNHRSQYDPFQQLYTFWKYNVPIPRIAASNHALLPGIEKIWRLCGAFEIPPVRKDINALRSLYHVFDRLVKTGESILMYPEGSRSTDGSLKKFQRGGIRIIYSAAREHGKEMIVVPHYIAYDHPIEEKYFPYLFPELFPTKKIKQLSTAQRQRVELYAFANRFVQGLIAPRGVVLHTIGEAFSLNECKDGGAVCKRAYNAINVMRQNYKGRLEYWP